MNRQAGATRRAPSEQQEDKADVSMRALVTGGSGFVAYHVIRQLLERGYDVHATVRDAAPSIKTQPLRALMRRFSGRLTLFEADLLRAGSFDDAMKGCRFVFHVASPFRMPEEIRDGYQEMVRPAVEGTNNVLTSVERTASVETLVFTSTVGAIFGDYVDVLTMENATLSEKYFNATSTVRDNPYHYAKTLAEKTAWAAHASQQRWRMVSINPGLILGPSMTPASESGSLFLLDELFKGYFFYGAPDFSFTTADVRDVAHAHIAAAENPEAAGRYIIASQTMTSFYEMSRIIRNRYSRDMRLPRTRLPHWPVRLLGPAFGLTQPYIRKHLGIRFRVDNSRSVHELGLTYRPVEETVLDHYEAWRKHRRFAPEATDSDRT